MERFSNIPKLIENFQETDSGQITDETILQPSQYHRNGKDWGLKDIHNRWENYNSFVCSRYFLLCVWVSLYLILEKKIIGLDLLSLGCYFCVA